jgi:integrase
MSRRWHRGGHGGGVVKPSIATARPRPEPPPEPVRVVTLTAAELRSLLREIVRDELAQLVEDLGTEATGPRLLTRQLTARQPGGVRRGELRKVALRGGMGGDAAAGGR